MSRPQLNVDVLATICDSLTDVADVLSLALTSSSVRPIATRWLLYMHPIRLKSEVSIRQFHSFLFADAPARAPHVRALDIDVRWPFPHEDQDAPGIVPLLLDILASCSHLQHISVVLQQALSPACLRIVHAIAALEKLHSLTVVGGVKTVWYLSCEMKSSPRRSNIRSRDAISGYWYPLAPEQVLPRFAQTLEELKVYHFMVDQDYIQTSGGILTEPIFDMTRYPAVRSLSTPRFMGPGKPLVDHFYHLFPALDGTLHLHQLDGEVREDTHSHIRAENQLAQERLRVWKKLDRVICDARMLYVLSLRCPIGLVMLDYATMDDQRYAADALRENPVPRLKVTVGHRPDKVYDGLFSTELTGKLTHLTLCLLHTNWIDEESPNGRAAGLQWDDVLDSSMLRPLHKLTHLRVFIHGGAIVYRTAPSPVVPSSEYALAFRESVFDLDGTAASFVPLFPCLQYLFLTASGRLSNWDNSDPYGGTKPYERWDVLRGWRIANQDTLDGTQDGARTLVALQDEVAETIIRQEDLVLSESDEATIQHRRRFE